MEIKVYPMIKSHYYQINNKTGRREPRKPTRELKGWLILLSMNFKMLSTSYRKRSIRLLINSLNGKTKPRNYLKNSRQR
jgi:hypothetical protein